MSCWKRFSDSSLHPPPLPTSGGAGKAPPPWILLDKQAYIADRCDHTTAYAQSGDGGEIGVTFVLAAPPHVSYLCVSSGTELGTEPHVLATDADLALLFSFHGSPYNHTVPGTHEYYVYRANRDRPTLTLLPRPPPDVFPWLWQRGYYFQEGQAGLLRYRRDPADVDGGAFLVAALCAEPTTSGTMDLYAYDSETNAWSRRPASFPDGKLPDSALRCDTVITVGGEAGTMGWVNLMRCIILCDVLPGDENDKKILRCIPVPPPILASNSLDESLSMYRDIAVVGGRIRYVEVQTRARPGSGRGRGIFTSDGWTAVTWSRDAADNSSEDGWRKDHEVHAHELSSSVDDNGGGNNTAVPGYELLPTLRDDDGDGFAQDGTPQPTLERIHVGHPKLGLQEDDVDIVYLMAKVNRRLDEAWVIAVDMKNKRLRGVAEFAGAERGLSFINAYNSSGISRYLNSE